MADDVFMSFIAFGFLIPFEFLNNPEYLLWRLSKPSEKEIYLYHLYYYLNCCGLEKSVLDLEGGVRLKTIVQRRETVAHEQEAYYKSPIWMEHGPDVGRYIEKIRQDTLERWQKVLQERQQKLEEAHREEKLAKIRSSWWYPWSWPLRKLRRVFLNHKN